MRREQLVGNTWAVLLGWSLFWGTGNGREGLGGGEVQGAGAPWALSARYQGGLRITIQRACMCRLDLCLC